jgi:hypothetical protein
MKYILGFVTAVGFVSLVAFNFYYVYGTDEVVTVTVESKERIVTQDSSKYLVFTNGEVFENTDSLLYWKFNSSDLYGELKEGETYTVRVYGWRIPFLSNYRNIIEIKK